MQQHKVVLQSYKFCTDGHLCKKIIYKTKHHSRYVCPSQGADGFVMKCSAWLHNLYTYIYKFHKHKNKQHPDWIVAHCICAHRHCIDSHRVACCSGGVSGHLFLQYKGIKMCSGGGR